MSNRRAQRHFDKVRDACNDLSDDDEREEFVNAVVDASDYYLSVKESLGAELLPVGKLDGLLTVITANAYYYKSIHTDALQVRKYLENVLSEYEARKYVWFQTSADGRAIVGTKPTATDIRNHIKSDDVVLILNECIRLIAEKQHMIEDICDSFTDLGFKLKTIADLRIANLEEVWIDGTRETNNA